MYSSIAVANALLREASSKEATITPMQLIKLVYLTHGWMLGLNGKPMLKEPIEAWRYGPVISKLYDAVKSFKDQPVNGPLEMTRGWGKKPVNEEISASDLELIQQVYAIYGDWDGISLSQLTHKNGTPWDITWLEHGKNAIISNDLIEHHYKQLYKEYTQKETKQAAG